MASDPVSDILWSRSPFNLRLGGGPGGGVGYIPHLEKLPEVADAGTLTCNNSGSASFNRHYNGPLFGVAFGFGVLQI